MTCFSDSARRLAGHAGVLLGWGPDTFWRATPEELAAVIEALTGPGAGDATPPAGAGELARLMEMYPDG